MVIVVGLLVLLGVCLGIAMDARIVDVVPLLAYVRHLPAPVRVVVYVLVGVPVGVGVVLYMFIELADFVGFVSRPFRSDR
jgi:hypothetical protein